MASEESKFINMDDVKDFGKDLAIIIIIVFFIRFFFAMPFQISGQSMYSSYYDREFIIVDRLSYRIWKPDRGDVVVFKPHVSKTKEFFLKRIIAIGWDILKIEWGKVFLKKTWEADFTELNEPYLNEDNDGFTFVGNKNTWKSVFEIPEWEYFVMWDNRNHSSDSRTCFSNCSLVSNTITKKDITGKIFVDFGYFSFKTFSFLHPNLWIETHPRFFSSPATYDYE